ncbi:transposase [Nocardia salmonicida]|uniref:transposase n=1 Tax=Nocardia salmonicida TaxID=53431 RepID=UPI0007A556BB|nr:transposase [Nocardia salmonicida]
MASTRADLADEQWAALEPVLPVGKKSESPPKWMKRQLINGIRWRTRVGTPWRDRAVATRYDKLAVRYLATVHIAAINIWLGTGKFLNTA